MLTLDELQQNDKTWEANGLQFVLDPFAASQIKQLRIDYNEAEDEFSVVNPDGPQSSC
ncbi:hypothetical protein [Effusibacillus dendaii]|uniref:Uncharacterized protein n=1 Tax=Effusibacillus dendaii TaxID=2743772 RepID=A0A7I8DEN4_9BACL|nr:hypothetical protein [Effusibacillus dendaii]BCJ87010.1 hypothetical protein skT53_19950 [Effusibacillus dendaii]